MVDVCDREKLLTEECVIRKLERAGYVLSTPSFCDERRRCFKKVDQELDQKNRPMWHLVREPSSAKMDTGISQSHSVQTAVTALGTT